MEEQLLEIINKYETTDLEWIILNRITSQVIDPMDYHILAKEITSHVFEFIEWLRYNCEGSTKGQWWYYDVSAQAGTMFTNEEGYMFWFNNIYKK
jgi:hypothetical protein